VKTIEGDGTHNSSRSRRRGADHAGVLPAAEFSGCWFSRSSRLDGSVSQLVSRFGGFVLNPRFCLDLPQTKSMREAKQGEHRVVLDVRGARCRDCLLSPSHRQLVGRLRLSSVG